MRVCEASHDEVVALGKSFVDDNIVRVTPDRGDFSANESGVLRVDENDFVRISQCATRNDEDIRNELTF